jgi:hypothetical protein
MSGKLVKSLSFIIITLFVSSVCVTIYDMWQSANKYFIYEDLGSGQKLVTFLSKNIKDKNANNLAIIFQPAFGYSFNYENIKQKQINTLLSGEFKDFEYNITQESEQIKILELKSIQSQKTVKFSLDQCSYSVYDVRVLYFLRPQIVGVSPNLRYFCLTI